MSPQHESKSFSRAVSEGLEILEAVTGSVSYAKAKAVARLVLRRDENPPKALLEPLAEAIYQAS